MTLKLLGMNRVNALSRDCKNFKIKCIWVNSTIPSTSLRSDTGQSQHTYSDSVDGVGIAIIVTVVLLAATIATGNHKDTAVSMATIIYPILHRFLRTHKKRTLFQTYTILCNLNV